MTMINKNLREWCPQRAHLVDNVRHFLPKGIRKSLSAIVERRSDYTLINHATIVLRKRDGVGPFYRTKCVQVTLINDEMETFELFARVLLELYYVDKG
jgi:hypothetical protein